MFPFLEIVPAMFYRLLTLLLHPIFWLVIALVALQYKRMADMKESMLGVKTGGVWKDVLVATGFGVAGGVLGSVLMIMTGLTVGVWLIYLWPVAIMLMLINARFLCFAYAGGILALTNLLFGYPPIKVPQLLALVAILHMVESILILLSGHLGAVPAYFKDRTGRLVGGFTLQKFWPIPIAVLVVGAAGAGAGEVIKMPDWWPLLKPDSTGDTVVYQILAVVAGLGYGDLAIARNPRDKSKLSFVFLAGYSLVLLVLALGAANSWFLALVAALFSPLGHEAIIHMGKKMEFAQEPLYSPHPDGLRVLDVVPGTPAWIAGLRSGDILVSANNIPIHTRAQFEYAVRFWSWAVELGYISTRDNRYYREVVSMPATGQPFGILFIPEGNERNYVQTETTGPAQEWWRKLKRKLPQIFR